MPPLIDRVRPLLGELRRRHVLKVAAVYAAVAWATIEVASTVFPHLALPEWSVTLVTVLALSGFPLTLVLAWAFDLTPDGVRRAGDDAPSARPGSRTAPTAFLLLGVAAALVVGFTVRGLRAPTPDRSAPAVTEIRSIAVLPFDNTGADADAYLSEGIAEELLHRLGRVPELRVAARTSSFALKQAQVDVREIGARLNVDAVLEGSVRSVGDELRVAARLVSTRDGYQLWSEVYERRSADLFRMQDDLSAAIVERLRPGLDDVSAGAGAAGSGSAGGGGAEPESHEAFELYLKGRYEWSRRTEDGLRAAVRYFEQAVARSPGYARAHLGLADAAAVLGFYDYMRPARAFPLARRAAARALELDPTLGEAHATLGYVALYHDYDFQGAEREFRRAIELNEGYAVAHQWYANLLTAMGRFDEAVREIRTAQQLDPLALVAHGVEGWIGLYARDYEVAGTRLRQTLQRDSTFFLAHLWLGQTLELAGRPGEAAQVLDRALRLSPHSVLAEAALARALAHADRPDEARRLLAGLEARGEREYVASYDLALVRLALGDTEGALARLERAAEDRAHAIAFLRVDPRLDPLRGHPRFQELLQRIAGA